MIVSGLSIIMFCLLLSLMDPLIENENNKLLLLNNLCKLFLTCSESVILSLHRLSLLWIPSCFHQAKKNLMGEEKKESLFILSPHPPSILDADL